MEVAIVELIRVVGVMTVTSIKMDIRNLQEHVILIVLELLTTSINTNVGMNLVKNKDKRLGNWQPYRNENHISNNNRNSNNSNGNNNINSNESNGGG
jgi:hypothetical protein